MRSGQGASIGRGRRRSLATPRSKRSCCRAPRFRCPRMRPHRKPTSRPRTEATRTNTPERTPPHFSLSEGFSCSSNAPRRNSSPASVAAAVWTSVNAAFGNCCQTARSSAVTVSQPNVNMYRPGSVTCPAFCQVILLTTAHFLSEACGRYPAERQGFRAWGRPSAVLGPFAFRRR
jgi:hypothetical protein